ncbi:hypothetical protein AAVH_12299 [Aphelenchoides avenae]|nr:hypothetical protein AAVH_12299 [Aphelenchus avenae]
MTTSTSKLAAACLFTLLALIPLSSAQYYNNYYYPYNSYPYNYYNYNNYNNGGYGYNNGYNNGYNGNNYYNYYSNGYYPYYNNYYSGGSGYVYSPRAHHSLGMPNIPMSMGSLGGLFLSCSTKNCAG